jgi:hypothetical protein
MIGHKRPGVDFRFCLQSQLSHAIDKGLPIQVVINNLPLFDTPENNVVQGPR